jgi:hypothetical protein
MMCSIVLAENDSNATAWLDNVTIDNQWVNDSINYTYENETWSDNTSYNETNETEFNF